LCHPPRNHPKSDAESVIGSAHEQRQRQIGKLVFFQCGQLGYPSQSVSGKSGCQGRWTGLTGKAGCNSCQDLKTLWALQGKLGPAVGVVSIARSAGRISTRAHSSATARIWASSAAILAALTIKRQRVGDKGRAKIVDSRAIGRTHHGIEGTLAGDGIVNFFKAAG